MNAKAMMAQPAKSGAWSFEELRAACRTGFSGYLGLELLEAGADRLRLRLPIDERHANSVGAVHGGAVAALADAAGGMGTMFLLPPGFQTATTDSQVQFLRPATGPELIATAEPVRIGRSRAVWTIRITNAEGRLVAQITQAQTIFQAKGATSDVQSGT